jgi:hypothetical protein
MLDFLFSVLHIVMTSVQRRGQVDIGGDEN